jgi:hypothetical protein
MKTVDKRNETIPVACRIVPISFVARAIKSPVVFFLKKAGHRQDMRKKPVPHFRFDAPAGGIDKIAPKETT